MLWDLPIKFHSFTILRRTRGSPNFSTTKVTPLLTSDIAIILQYIYWYLLYIYSNTYVHGYGEYACMCIEYAWTLFTFLNTKCCRLRLQVHFKQWDCAPWRPRRWNRTTPSIRIEYRSIRSEIARWVGACSSGSAWSYVSPVCGTSMILIDLVIFPWTFHSA